MVKMYRSPTRLIHRLIEAVDRGASQLKLFRMMVGGVWFKAEGVWHQADVARVYSDGSMMLGYKQTYFSSTHNSVQALENYGGF